VTRPSHPSGGRRARPGVLVAHPSAELYGSDRMMLESVAGLVAAGWAVTVTVPQAGPVVEEARRLGARVVVLPTPVLRKSAVRPAGLVALAVRSLAALGPSLRLIRASGADVVYVSTLTVPLWLVVARLLRRPAVCHVHEAEASARALVRRALAAPLLLATTVLANSRYSLDVLLAAVPRLSGRTRVLANGVSGPAVVRPAREWLDGPLRLLYVGRLSPRKGVDVAVEALGLLLADGVDARLDVVGAVFEGYAWFERDLRAAAAALPPGRVVLHGFTDPWPHVDAADVVLVPSRLDEPFGNTAVEAGLAARPVVVSDSSGLREATADLEAAVRVRPGDARALADGVLRVRAAWPALRAGALRDAEVLADRHGPQRYRSDIVRAVQHLLVPGSARPDVPAGEPA
jgi:glycosyltransferase involved in cell wall biosynthesis